MSKPYRPANGSEGMAFFEQFCWKCGRDSKYRETQDGRFGCPIMAASLFYEMTDSRYPSQYLIADDGIGTNARCTEFMAEEPK